MHFPIYLEILKEGLIPSRDTFEDKTSRAVPILNWIGTLGRLLAAVAITVILPIVVDFALGTFKHEYPWNIIVWFFYVAIAVLAFYIGPSAIVTQMILSMKYLRRVVNQKQMADVLIPDDGDRPTYIEAVKELTAMFWKGVHEYGMRKYLRYYTKYFGEPEVERRERLKKVTPPEGERNVTSAAAVNWHTLEFQNDERPNKERTQKIPGYVMIMLACAIIATGIMVWDRLGIYILLAFIAATIGAVLVREVTKMRAGYTMKFMLAGVFIVTTLVISGGLVAWSFPNVQNSVKGAWALMGFGNGGSITSAQFSGVSYSDNDGTAATNTPTPTASPTASPTVTLVPSATLEPTPERKKVVGYSPQQIELVRDTTIYNINQHVVSLNSVVVAYNSTAQKMADEGADLASWQRFYEGAPGEYSPKQACIENRDILQNDALKDGDVVLSFLSKIKALVSDPNEPISDEDALFFELQARLAISWCDQADAFAQALVAWEKLFNKDSTLVDQVKLKIAIQQAYDAETQMSNIADEYNKSRRDGQAELMKLQAPNGEGNFTQWLEKQYMPEEERIKITTTPLPTPINIAPSLIPSTNTPEPTPEPTEDACLASITVDDGRYPYGVRTSLTVYYLEFEQSDTVYVEKYSPECGGWVFNWEQPVNGYDYWAVAEYIEQTWGLDSYGYLSTDKTNFHVKRSPDPEWAGNDVYVIVETGAYVHKNWPVPQATQTAYVETCTTPPGYTDTQKITATWQNLGNLYPGLEGNWDVTDPDGTQHQIPKASVNYRKCGTEYVFFVSIYKGPRYWFTQRDNPSGISADNPFWVKSDGSAYLLAGTFTW